MTRERTFPPGVGWWQGAMGLAAVLLVAGVVAAPRFRTTVIGTAPGSDALAAPGTQPSAGTLADASGRPVVTARRPGTTGGPVGPTRSAAIDCAQGRNGGSTAPGVTQTMINIASTTVTTGTGSGFLKQAGDGVQAAIAAANQAGGVCGRKFHYRTINSGWDASVGQHYIEDFLHEGNVFALVGQPDSEGLNAAVNSHVIDDNKFPAVGTDGMLKSQYHSNWVWPVAASTVTNMHIAADYAFDNLHAKSFGIIYDTDYKFGPEGAKAFAEEVRRRGGSVLGYPGDGCSQAYCGISSKKQSYTQEATTFNNACKPCDVVVMLLEPGATIAWMGEERNNTNPWYGKALIGGEPLFDDGLGQQCEGCGKAQLNVWTGYKPAIQPFDALKPVYTFCQELHAVAPSDDCHNEFTEGAYLGARLFIEAVRRVGDLGLPLTRENLKQVLDSGAFDLGMTFKPVVFRPGAHIANTCMTAYYDNYSGGFNGWSYLQAVGWKCDIHAKSEL